MFNDPTKRVSVSGNKHTFAGFNVRNDDVIPVRQGSLNGQLQTLGLWKFIAVGTILVPEREEKLNLNHLLCFLNGKEHVFSFCLKSALRY